MHRRILIPVILSIAAAVAATWPARVNACTCTAEPIHHSEPKAGATDVARNRAVVFRSHLVSETVTFEEADGAPVEFDATHAPGPASDCSGTLSELVPREPLKANTTYVIRVSGPEVVGGPEGSLTFTTGTGMLDEVELTMPRGRASMMSGTPASSPPSCGGGPNVVCVGLDDYDDIEVIARLDGRVIMRWLDLERSTPFSLSADPDCIEFRRRGPTGKRSKPFEICGEALERHTYREDQFSMNEWGGVVCDDGHFGVVESSSEADAGAKTRDVDSSENPAASGAGGCSLTKTSSSSHLPLVALLSLFALHRRRSRLQ